MSTELLHMGGLQPSKSFNTADKKLKVKETFVTLSEQFAKCLDLVVRL